MFRNRVLRKIVGCKLEEVTGDWRNLYNEELCDLHRTKYYFGDKIEADEMGRDLAYTKVSAIVTWFHFVF